MVRGRPAAEKPVRRAAGPQRDADTSLRGGTPGAVTDLDQANSSFVLDGNTVTVNLTTGATYAAKATLIQTQIVALGGIFTGATFVYDTDAFLLTLAGSDAIPGSVFSDTAVGTDTDIAALLGMTAASGASYRQGHAAETIGSAIDEIVALATTGAPVALMLDADVPANFGTVNTRAALAAYAEANGFIYALLDTAEQAVTTGDTTSQTYGVFNRQQGQVAAVYSEPGQHPDVGLLALLSGQRLDETGSLVNPQGKPLPRRRANHRLAHPARRAREEARLCLYDRGWHPVVSGWPDRT